MAVFPCQTQRVTVACITSNLYIISCHFHSFLLVVCLRCFVFCKNIIKRHRPEPQTNMNPTTTGLFPRQEALKASHQQPPPPSVPPTNFSSLPATPFTPTTFALPSHVPSMVVLLAFAFRIGLGHKVVLYVCAACQALLLPLFSTAHYSGHHTHTAHTRCLYGRQACVQLPGRGHCLLCKLPLLIPTSGFSLT